MKLEKKNSYVKVFMGTTYTIAPGTIGELKETLEQIIKDLPEDNSLELCEFYMDADKMQYLLKNGITCEDESSDYDLIL